MRRGRLGLYCVLGAIVSSTCARAVAPNSNPYTGIVDRNLFGLRPAPPMKPPEPPKAPAPQLWLTGITTILGNKRALLKAQVQAKPPQPAREEFYILTEGQRDGDIEVVSIDETAGTVKVKNHGNLETLDFDKNGVKLPSASSLPPTPGVPGAPGAPGAPPMPNVPVPPPSAASHLPQHQIPQRPIRGNSGPQSWPGAPGQAENAVNTGAPGAFGNTGGGTQIPEGMPIPNDVRNLTGDQQAILIEIGRQQAIEAGDQEAANMFPPTQ